MQKVNQERQAWFSQEASRILQREGFGVTQLENGELEISKDSVLLDTISCIEMAMPANPVSCIFWYCFGWGFACDSSVH